MGRRLAPEEKALWGRVMATVKPLAHNPPRAWFGEGDHAKHGGGAAAVKAKPKPVAPPSALRATTSPSKLGKDKNTLDATWDRRIHKGGVIPDISVDLHETTLSGAYARLDRTLEQAIHQKLRVVLLVTGHARGHDRASGHGRGAIAAVVRDWLAASRHASAISAVRQAHPRHGGAGALYIVLKR
jgi:DNA-nicking Smr family endonuclease